VGRMGVAVGAGAASFAAAGTLAGEETGALGTAFGAAGTTAGVVITGATGAVGFAT
jgi:hypothetical protein